MNPFEKTISTNLEDVYHFFRSLQATHDGFETRCIGSGNCCKIGLRIHLSEAWNIARNIKRQYWLTAESRGINVAKAEHADVIERLKYALTDETWDPENEESTERKCVFFISGFGCSVYEYRPLVCRAYGVISPVQDGVCPRKRLDDGGHELIPRDEKVDYALQLFDSTIETWGDVREDLDYSMHIAAGVLRFLLPNEELMELIQNTDSKFWLAAKGYRHQLHITDFETPVEIKTDGI